MKRIILFFFFLTLAFNFCEKSDEEKKAEIKKEMKLRAEVAKELEEEKKQAQQAEQQKVRTEMNKQLKLLKKQQEEDKKRYEENLKKLKENEAKEEEIRTIQEKLKKEEGEKTVKEGDTIAITKVTEKPIKISGDLPQFPKSLTTVVVRAMLYISEEGKVLDTRVYGSISSESKESIIKILKKWKYKPAKVNNIKVKVWLPVPIKVYK